MLKNDGQKQAAPFAAGQEFDLGVDTILGEQELLQITTEREALLTEYHELAAIADRFDEPVFRVELEASLVHVVEPDQLPYLDCSGVRSQLPHDHFQKRGLAGAVAADDADFHPRMKIEMQILKQGASSERVAHVDQIHDAVPHGGRRRNQ